MWTLAAIFPSLGLPEMLVIFGIFFLLFGAAKLPQLGKGIGEGIRNFKKGLKGGEEADLPARTDPPRQDP
jgi:sec-independent protein translocase protein TatA